MVGFQPLQINLELVVYFSTFNISVVLSNIALKVAALKSSHLIYISTPWERPEQLTEYMCIIDLNAAFYS